MPKTTPKSPAAAKTYVITGPTSGIGRLTAFELARHGDIILVGRDQQKLTDMQQNIERRGGRAVSVVCDLADPASVRRAAAEIVALNRPIAGLLNNAGVFPSRPGKTALGWDLAFATNHLGPFALTEALIPHLPDGASVVFVASAVEDSERPLAKAVGFRGGRYISVEASVRGEWIPGGSKMPGADAYATSKQCVVAAAMVLARENPRLRVNVLEPGFTPNTGLAHGANPVVGLVSSYILPLFAPFLKYWSTPKRAATLAAKVAINASGQTGIYYDYDGSPMRGSALVQTPAFTNRVVAETRALLASVPA